MRPIDAVTLIADGRICGNCKDFERCDGNVAFCESARVRRAINEAPNVEYEQVKWISVKDRLPPYGERILVVNEAYEANRGYTRYNCGITVRDPHLNFTFLGHKVTHWQPLPEPPINFERGD